MAETKKNDEKTEEPPVLNKEDNRLLNKVRDSLSKPDSPGKRFGEALLAAGFVPDEEDL